ncbi:zinc-dependent alcohol dehydrogenase [Amycolatopsis nalaikhensis]|uniref:Zinc-binding dehydrogenase n=1 Tax=Amycolatopsis nalaikhensis TaxID=715472 RepID=A0ABY8XYI1_9PSEU|nr:zinc-binding dehydrogenase [Amycolatopsis sp. 2-2]WIV60711.1 zinc-binding dehydrogenase [Amycolatopsis sp. 2-2]
MHALQLKGPFDFDHRTDAPAPHPGPGQISVRLATAAICGSDMPKVRSTADRRSGTTGFPIHECVGYVVDADPATGMQAGRRVLAMPVQEQGLAEVYLAELAATHAVAADHLTDAQATLIQPIATVLYAAGKLAADLSGRRVTVLGLGPIGLLTAHVLSRRGAVVTGVDPVIRDPALTAAFGLTRHVRDTAAAWVRRDPEPAEICVEAVGHQQHTLRDAITLTGHSGTVLAMGVPDEPDYVVPFETLLRRNQTLIGSITPTWQEWFGSAEAYLCRHLDELGLLLTHHVAITDAASAYRLYDRPAADRLKVILTADWSRS